MKKEQKNLSITIILQDLISYWSSSLQGHISKDSIMYKEKLLVSI